MLQTAVPETDPAVRYTQTSSASANGTAKMSLFQGFMHSRGPVFGWYGSVEDRVATKVAIVEAHGKRQSVAGCDFEKYRFMRAIYDGEAPTVWAAVNSPR